MNWPNVFKNPGPVAPGRYCLAVCYCGTCPHWEPAPPINYRRRATQITPPRDLAWWEREPTD